MFILKFSKIIKKKSAMISLPQGVFDMNLKNLIAVPNFFPV